jgi:hypothetical protein
MTMKRSRTLTVENIWYYYKLPILIGGAVVALVIYMLATAPPQRTAVLNVVVVGSGISQDHLASLEQQATAAVVPDPSHEEVAITALVTAGPLAANSAASIKLLALLSTQSVDVLIMDRQDFAALAARHVFLNLGSLAAFAHVSSRRWPGGGTRVAPTYGVTLAGHTRWSDVSAAAGDTVAGIVAATPRRATAIRFVQWLLQA